MQTILVPLDESPAAEAILPLVAAFACATSAALVLVRVPDRPPAGVRPFEVRGGAVAYAEEYLAERADQLIEQGIKARSATLPEGPVAGAILQSIKDREAAMVAMATHGRTGPGTTAFGGVTNGVLARCPVPVLMARSWLDGHEAALIENGVLVLCPLDGSAYAEGALPTAEAIASALGGRLERLTVEEPAGPTILAAAAERSPSLIVMAAHGHGAPGTTVMGGVAEHVLRSGATPLVLLGPAAIPSPSGRG